MLKTESCLLMLIEKYVQLIVESVGHRIELYDTTLKKLHLSMHQNMGGCHIP